MLFTEARFAALTVVCWLAFKASPARFRPVVLLACGLVFYALFALPSLPVILGLTAVAFVVPPRLGLFGIAAIVGVLAYDKGFGSGDTVLGLSFLAFELIHLVVERMRGRVPRPPLQMYLGWALYFPCRIAGPIRRYPDFEAAVRAAVPSSDNFSAGAFRVLVGLTKKFALADLLAMTVAEGLAVRTAPQAWKVLIAFTFQIYLDFSAYSDIAIGISRMFGITVPENFNWPYLSQSIQEFWTRWHITLSTWIRDYVFTPLGQAGFRTPLRARPTTIAVISYLVAFVVVGAWHGLAPHFVAWGAYHGVLLSVHHMYKRTVAGRLAQSAFYWSPAAVVLSTLATFSAVTLGRVLFLAPDMPAAVDFVKALGGR